MKKVRFGIVGVGNMGSSYFNNIFETGMIENGEVVAVCDLKEDRLEAIRAKAKNKDIQYFTDYKEMLDSGLCDVVMVEVPHYDHPKIVIECLKRDINVICDKPAGVYAKQVREMNEIAKKSKAKFGMMFNQRTDCTYRKMKEIIAEGGIGELQRMTWIITNWYRPQCYFNLGSWRASWLGEGGGVLINQCPHQIDLVSWIIGEQPEKVRGFCQYGKWHDIEVEDEVTAFFTYKNGATGMFITSTGEAPGTNRFEVSGTKGKLLCENGKLFWYKNEVDSKEYCLTSENAFSSPKCEIIEVETDGKSPQHAGIINNFANALLGLEELFVEGTEGINGVELMNAIEYSGWHNGEEVTLPVDENKYLEELNAKRVTSKLRVATDKVADTSGSYGTTTK